MKPLLPQVAAGFCRQAHGCAGCVVGFVDLSVVASFDSGLDRIGVISGGSIYPFAWNILLAARNEGLGGTLTTFVGARAGLQELLGVPSHYAFAAMIPMGKPVKQLTKLSRKPVV